MRAHDLLPRPASCIPLGDWLPLPTTLAIGGEPIAAAALNRLRGALSPIGIALERASASDRSSVLMLARRRGGERQGYRLQIAHAGIRVEAADDAGLFYGLATLAQWIELHTETPGAPPRLPCVLIEDRPVFRHRGVMLDISRNRVPRLDRLEELIERLSLLKINQLQLYTEHTFAYPGHEEVWADASPLTGAEIRRLDRFAADRFVELVPNQNSFGHLHRWLRLPAYRDLAECPEGVRHPFGDQIEPFSLCPTDPRALDWLAGLYRELLPHFSSGSFNAGLDETFDLGEGRSAQACAERGKSAVYLDFVRAVHGLATGHRRRLQMWGDIVLAKPGAIERLPRDLTGLIWGYEANHPFADQTRAFQEAGLDFYVCPGTSSWNSFTGRSRNALKNIDRAARAGAAQGASGLLLTDWGDFGHLQPPAISALASTAAADAAWAGRDASDSRRLHRATDRWFFDHPDGGLAAVAQRAGDAHLMSGSAPNNGTALFYAVLFAHQPMTGPRFDGLSSRGLGRAVDELAACTHALRRISTDSVPAERAARELTWSADAAACGARLARLRLERGPERTVDSLPAGARRSLLAAWQKLEGSFLPLWLESSRPGGAHASNDRLARVAGLLGAPIPTRMPGIGPESDC